MMILGMLLLWALIVGGIIALVAWVFRSLVGLRPSDEAVAILDQRFARSEISQDEYAARRRELLHSRQ
jgi:uncharacterized membrane protein